MKPVVFCDFDGTITLEDTFVKLLDQLNPEASARIIPQLYNRTLTLREGGKRLLESVPSHCTSEVIQFSQAQPIRPGFVEFLDFLDLQNIPLVVVSGGIKMMVKTVLGSLTERVAGIYAVNIDTSGDYWKVDSDFEAGNELVAKVNVMDLYPTDEKIVIGDSITDLKMALAAPLVFARQPLTHYLDEQNKTYIPWQDFFEIRDYLAKAWSVDV